MACVEELECSTAAGCTSSPPSLERLEERETEPWKGRERERSQSINIDNIDYGVALIKLPVYRVVQTAFVSVMSFLDHPLQRQRRQLRQPTSLPGS